VSSKPVLFFSFVFYLKVALDQAHAGAAFPLRTDGCRPSAYRYIRPASTAFLFICTYTASFWADIRGMAAKAEKTEFIDNTARRKWDKEECVLPQSRVVKSQCSR